MASRSGITNRREVKRTFDKWSDEIDNRLLDVQRITVLLILGVRQGRETIAGLLHMTPVDTGRARGNWQVSLTTPETGTVEDLSTARNGQGPTGEEVAKALSAMHGAKPYGVIWVSNNLPYIIPLNDGHSPQAGAGWIDQAVQRAFSIVREKTGVTIQ